MTTLDNPSIAPDPSTVPVMPTALRYGGIVALVLIVFGLITYLFDLVDYGNNSHPGTIISNVLFYVAIIAAVVLAIKKHRNEDLGGYISFGRCLGVGTLTGVVLGVIQAVWTFIFMTLIAPDIAGKIREVAIQQAEERGTPPEQMEQMEGMMNFFTSPTFMAIMIILATVFGAFIISLIAGAIMKKERPAFS